MPFKLDDIDYAILESLNKDGRKSFRQISREIKISTPTVKARYERLVNIGLIKAVLPIIDFGKLENKAGTKIDAIRSKTIKNHDVKITKGLLVKMSCDYCGGPVPEKPSILKFANFERFFCCTSCRSLYKEKYKGRIEKLSGKTDHDLNVS
ncbi:AsnC family transcriptional regulator [Candidatus Nitrosotenuis sp. DW1]|uniref:AsnC family transcriptional regulator n=1 Tax=Candidatus Nitrosotenuis sp. DW1 TaxID=2259672 RepID=UPI0015CB9402|nr:AsnC family transcriptional regulator [Candidatus Nitrosotenuis sp. DW1]QLH09594.1 AsnC family transcriptional regulator [Candidatus Nitrosotenuis sp. DW1]